MLKLLLHFVLFIIIHNIIINRGIRIYGLNGRERKKCVLCCAVCYLLAKNQRSWLCTCMCMNTEHIQNKDSVVHRHVVRKANICTFTRSLARSLAHLITRAQCTQSDNIDIGEVSLSLSNWDFFSHFSTHLKFRREKV